VLKYCWRACCLVADGGSVIVQRHYHNFKKFRIYDLSDHKLSNQHLIVSMSHLSSASLKAR
jgi:hypothetical protein